MRFKLLLFVLSLLFVVSLANAFSFANKGSYVVYFTLKGNVAFEDGSPVHGAIVELFDNNGKSIASTATSLDGSYKISAKGSSSDVFYAKVFLDGELKATSGKWHLKNAKIKTDNSMIFVGRRYGVMSVSWSPRIEEQQPDKVTILIRDKAGNPVDSGYILIDGKRKYVIDGEFKNVEFKEDPLYVVYKDTRGKYLSWEGKVYKDDPKIVVSKVPSLEIEKVEVYNKDGILNGVIHKGETFTVKVTVKHTGDWTYAAAGYKLTLKWNGKEYVRGPATIWPGEETTYEFKFKADYSGEKELFIFLDANAYWYGSGEPAKGDKTDVSIRALSSGTNNPEPPREKDYTLKIVSVKSNRLETNKFNVGDTLTLKVEAKYKDGQPVSGKEVKLYYGNTFYRVKTIVNGYAVFEFKVPSYWNDKVNLKVTDGKKSDSKQIEVSKEYTLLLSRDTPYVGGKIHYKIKVLDANGREVRDARVYLEYIKRGNGSSNHRDPIVLSKVDKDFTKSKVGGEEIFSEKYASNEYLYTQEATFTQRGYYSAYLDVPYQKELSVTVTAAKDGNTGVKEDKLQIQGKRDYLTLKVVNFNDEVYNLGEDVNFDVIVQPKGYDIRPSLQASAKFGVAKVSEKSDKFHVSYVSEKVTRPWIGFDKTGYVYADYGYNEVRLSAKDNIGSTGSSTVKIKVTNIYKVDIVSAPSTVTSGEKVSLRVKVTDYSGDPVEGATVKAKGVNGEEIVFDKEVIGQPGVYEATYDVPLTDKNSWTLNVTAEKDGNFGYDVQSVNVRGISLNVVVTSPSNGKVYNRGENIHFEVTATYSDGSPVSGTVTASGMDNSFTLAPQGNGVYSYDYSISSSESVGSKTVTFTVTDQYGNSGSASVNLEVSSDYIVSIVEPANSVYYVGQKLPIRASVKDANGRDVGGATVVATLSNGNTLTLVENNGIYEGEVTLTNAGSLTVTVNAEKNGNSGSDSKTVTVLQGGALNVTLRTDLINDPHANKGEQYRVYVNVSNIGNGAINGIKVYAFSDGHNSQFDSASKVVGTLASGEYSEIYFTVTSDEDDTLRFVVNGTDVAGNVVEKVETYTILADNPAGGNDGKLVVKDLNSNRNLINGSGKIELDVAVLNDGEANSTGTNIVVKVFDAGWNDVSSNFAISIEPTDVEIEGGKEVTYEFNVTALGVQSGNYFVNVSASGIDKNSGAAVGSNELSFTFTVDSDAPEITLKEPENGAKFNVNTVTFRFNASDNHATTLHYVLVVDGVTVYTTDAYGDISYVMNGLVEGSHEWYVNVSDDVNNVKKSEVRTFTIDVTPPTVNITSPADGSSVGPSAFLNVSANDVNGIDKIWYSVDGGNNIIYTSEVQLSTLSLSEGIHTIEVWANDTYGNVGYNKTTFVYGSAPSITLITSTLIKSGDWISFNITDDVAVDKAVYEYNGVNYTFEKVEGSIYSTNVSKNWASGSQTLVVYANDTYGHMASKTFTFTVDNEAPAFSKMDVYEPNESEVYGGKKKVPINATATDSNGISVMQYKWDNGEWVNLTFDSGYWVGESDVSTFSSGYHNLTIRAVDVVGNVNETRLNITIDNDAPKVTILAPSSGSSYEINDVVEVRAEINDSNLGQNVVPKVYLNDRYKGNMTYNETTRVASATISLDLTGDVKIKVVVEDELGNVGEGIATVSVKGHPSYSGGGGGGVFIPSNETEPTPIVLDVQVSPAYVEMMNNESVNFTVTLKNSGEENLSGLRIYVKGLNADDYEAIGEPYTLLVGEIKNVTLVVKPKSLDDGEYTLRVRVENWLTSASNVITLKVKNATKIKLMAEANETCSEAAKRINALREEGLPQDELTSLENKYDEAISLIDSGDYGKAVSMCKEIVEYTPNESGPGGLTGLFIAVGEFMWDNGMWIIVATSVALALYLGRSKVAGIVRKLSGKLGKKEDTKEKLEEIKEELENSEEKKEE